MFASAVVMVAVGLAAYHQMNDRPGVSIGSELRQSLTRSSGVYANRGVFVALEGGEGAGKSTQARLLQAGLIEAGYDVVLTHEPGDSDVGRRLREILLSPATGALDHRAEALLYAADKAEHVEKLVKPALARGAVVITDRYVDSTLAYQGAGRDLLPRDVERVARWATADLRPHLTVLLDLAPDVGLRPLRVTGPARSRAAGLPRAGARGIPAAGGGRPGPLSGRRCAATRAPRSPPRSAAGSRPCSRSPSATWEPTRDR